MIRRNGVRIKLWYNSEKSINIKSHNTSLYLSALCRCTLICYANLNDVEHVTIAVSTTCFKIPNWWLIIVLLLFGSSKISCWYTSNSAMSSAIMTQWDWTLNKEQDRIYLQQKSVRTKVQSHCCLYIHFQIYLCIHTHV